jgi:Phosphotransferase enzyme family
MKSIFDPQFPQISTILDTDYIAEVLQNTLFPKSGQRPSNIKITRCTVGEKRYKPGKIFMLSYHLLLQDTLNDCNYEQLLTAQLIPIGLKFPEDEACQEKATFISDVNMRLWVFPHDRKLLHLPRLLNTNDQDTYFETFSSAIKLLQTERIASIQTKVMHYLPEMSCMIRYTLEVADNSIEIDNREIILYGKNYHDDCGAEIYGIMRLLANQTDHCAAPLFYDKSLKTLWQSHVAGKTFEWDSSLVNQPELMAKVAICIASFHGCSLSINKEYGFTQIFEQLKATGKIALSLNEKLHQQVQLSVEEVLRNHQQIDWSNAVKTPIHLDLKMGNLLISDDKVSLIDMDCVSMGDPLVDLGSFVANLYLNGLRAGADVAEIDNVVAIFCDEYCYAVDFDVNRVQLNWYISAALLHEVVRRSLRQQDEDRLRQVCKIIDLSKHYSALCRGYINSKNHATQW